MTRLQRLQERLNTEFALITDPMMIFYFTGHLYHPDERFIGLCVPKENDPYLIINALFPLPDDIKIIVYKDGEDPFTCFKDIQVTSFGIDQNMPARFVLPLQDMGFNTVNINDTLQSLRRQKSSDEIQTMHHASQRNDAIMKKVRAFLKPGVTEIEVAQYIETLQTEAPQTGVSFTPIALFSENADDPHGVPSQRVLLENDMVLIDMGGMYENYASDMTRCFFMKQDHPLEVVYDIVERAYQNALKAIRIGTPLSDVDKAARDTITEAGYGEYFTHRTGHGIGIETHEPLDVSSTNETLIEQGMVFSVEPGVYVPGVGGVRLESLVAITAEGPLVLNDYPMDRITNTLTQ